jgi:hypothetical protein
MNLKNNYRNSEAVYQAEGQNDHQQRCTSGKQAGCHFSFISSPQLNAASERLFILFTVAWKPALFNQ